MNLANPLVFAQASTSGRMAIVPDGKLLDLPGCSCRPLWIRGGSWPANSRIGNQEHGMEALRAILEARCATSILKDPLSPMTITGSLPCSGSI